MSIVTLRLLVDFGLLVLIWMIQLIVYPGFLYYSKENLIAWHTRYTPLIGGIVAPLMVLQLGIAIHQIIDETNVFSLISLLIISIIWISTFFQFVPMHSNISRGKHRKEMLHSLVRKNWLRTILWTFLFVFDLIMFFSMA